MRILFILKQNETYGFTTYTRKSSGLFNSVKFIADALNKHRHVTAQVIEVADNNSIDREVTEFKPDIVVIEALWVVPNKFDVLKKLHPNVQWFVHLHSHIPFLAAEGIAADWIVRYACRDVGIIANSEVAARAIKVILRDNDVTFLPNIYDGEYREPKNRHRDVIDVGCFGAVRPMKNQLLQALVAIEFAREKGKFLRFHINGSRVETGGDAVYKNLIQLFDHQMGAELIRHPWYEREDFLKVVAQMDIGMQVSLSETFNIVCADYVAEGIPCVASKEVYWLSDRSKAQDDDPLDILRVMKRAWHNRLLARWNQYLLVRHSERAEKIWFKWLKSNF